MLSYGGNITLLNSTQLKVTPAKWVILLTVLHWELQPMRVYQAITQLTDNKVSGSEQLKFTSLKVAALLAICFSSFMIH